MTDTFRVELPHRGDDDVVAARLFLAGARGVQERPDALVAWFDARTTLDDDLATRAQWFREADRDWQEAWKATIGPVSAGRFWVVPTWLADSFKPPAGTEVIVLDPGRAFGSGHHSTTAMCLELLDAEDRSASLRGRTVADIGCGSGILAIGAARLGATVTAVDIDPAAVASTRENAASNAVSVRVTQGSVDTLDEAADIVVANLITDVVADLAVQLAQATRTTLLVSGITAARQNVALDALVSAGMIVDDVRDENGWLAARLHPTATARGAARDR